MAWLAFIFALEAGFQQQQFEITPPGELLIAYEISSPYTKLEAGIELFQFLNIGGSTAIHMAGTDNWKLAPFDSRFTFYSRIKWRYLTIGWEHLCIHPILSDDRPQIGFLSGGGDKIYLRLEGKVGGK